MGHWIFSYLHSKINGLRYDQPVIQDDDKSRYGLGLHLIGATPAPNIKPNHQEEVKNNHSW